MKPGLPSSAYPPLTVPPSEPRPGASTSERTSGLLSADHHGYPPRDTSHPLRDIEPSVFRDAARDHDRIRRLELEVAQLRKQVSLDGSVASPSTLKDVPKDSPACPPDPLPSNVAEKPGDGLEYKFIKGNNFKTRYFGSHNAWSSFKQLRKPPVAPRRRLARKTETDPSATQMVCSPS